MNATRDDCERGSASLSNRLKGNPQLDERTTLRNS